MALSTCIDTTSAAIGAVVVAAGLLAAGNAQAGKLCLTYPSKMRYHGLGEDYWTSNGNKPLAYAYARITRSGTTSAWSGYLDRGGCAPSTLTWVGASANYTVTVWSKSGTIAPAYGGGANIGVEATDCGNHTGYSAGDACPGSAVSFTYPAKTLGAFTATTVALGPVTSSVAATQNRHQAIFSAMMLGTFALATDAGGTANSNRTFYIRVGNNTLTKTNVT